MDVVVGTGLRPAHVKGCAFWRVPFWVWLKIKQEGQTAGFGPCFHLPGFHFGTGFLSHSLFGLGGPHICLVF